MLNIVAFSNVRKDVLLYLYDEGPKSFTEIRERFDITAPEISPRLKELVEHELVGVDSKKYFLTPMGRTIVRHFKPFAGTIDAFETHYDFWQAHDIGGIPDEFLSRISEVRNARYIEDDAENVSNTRLELSKILSESEYVCGAASIFGDDFPEMIFGFISDKKPFSLVTTPQIINIIKSKHLPTYLKYTTYGNVSMYLLKESLGLSFAVTDKYLFLSLNFRNGKIDSQSNLVSEDGAALKWGMDLFEHYKARSVRIK